MLDEKDLQAIAALMGDLEARLNQRMDEQEIRLNQRMDEQETRFNQRMDEQEARLNQRMDEQAAQFSQRMDEQEARLNQRMDEQAAQLSQQISEQETTILRQVRALLENGVEKEIRLLAEGHGQLLRRFPDAEKLEDVRERVSTLEHVALEHRKELDALKKVC